MNNPTAASLDTSGNLYVTDQSNQRIRRIDTSGTIQAVAGNVIRGSQATGARLRKPPEFPAAPWSIPRARSLSWTR